MNPRNLNSAAKFAVLYMLGDITAGPAYRFAQWLELVRKRSGKYRASGFPHRPYRLETMPSRNRSLVEKDNEQSHVKITDEEDSNISCIFEEASDFIDHVESVGGRALVHCFEGRSRSATESQLSNKI
uniref:Dual specificity phosphatase catalytic domain-containing protein n=1 Tax=Salix viminalis TaxID=40686 RepID=A0A6N2NFZ0_SALVM